MSAKRPVLLFDVMSTLVYDPYAVEQPAFFGITWQELAQLKDPTAWIEFELGKIDEQEFYRRFFRDRRSFDHEGLRQIMTRSYRWLEGMDQLLTDLRQAELELHAFSNYPSWYHLIEEKLKLSQYLPWSFVSCNTGLRKPKAEAYRDAARVLDRAPQDCVFVDDQPANCKAAEGVGMSSLLFSDAASLRTRLTGLGLI